MFVEYAADFAQYSGGEGGFYHNVQVNDWQTPVIYLVARALPNESVWLVPNTIQE